VSWANRSPEQKARTAEARRKRYAEDPEYRARCIERDRNRSPEQKARRSQANAERERKRKAEDPNYKARRADISRRYRERHAEELRQNREDPEMRARYQAYIRMREYGLMPEQHAAMLESQGGLCAICRGPGGKRGLVVDHCHETGFVRGLICSNCNSGMGKLGDTPAGLMRAIKYLREARKRQQLALEMKTE
jgi:5-methylcytosine-specific restriction endonuclease McrA